MDPEQAMEQFVVGKLTYGTSSPAVPKTMRSFYDDH
jgi:hypothetical protein